MALTVNFNARESLITTQEVIDNSPVSGTSYPEMRVQVLSIEEEKLFRKCFGWDFYQDLMADKVDYRIDGGGDEQYTNFRETTTYSVGDFVLHEGRLYEVTQATTGAQRPSLEYQNPYFKLAPKFATDEYNFIWERYLKTILAFTITESSIVYRAYQDTPKGIVKKYDEGQTASATLREVSALKSDYAGDIADMIKSMECFILENKELAVFANYKAIKDACGERCQPRRRHYGFNTNTKAYEY